MSAEVSGRRAAMYTVIGLVLTAFGVVATAVGPIPDLLRSSSTSDSKSSSPNGDGVANGTVSALVIRSGFSSKCLDVYDFNAEDEAEVVQWPCNGKANQSWFWSDDKSIKNGHSGKCLDVLGLKKADGTRVVQYACKGQPSQQWTRGADKYGNMILKNSYAGKCLDDFGFSTQDGSPLAIWQCDNLPNQTWIMYPPR